MKTLMVYYSLEGNTKYVAEMIKEFTGADILPLIPAKEYPKGNVTKYIWGGKSAVFGDKPKLLPYEINISDYDTIVIGTPVWASTFVPPIRTFLQENKLSGKKIGIVTCQAGVEADKCIQLLTAELKDSTVIATISLKDPLKNKSEDTKKQIQDFCEQLNK